MENQQNINDDVKLRAQLRRKKIMEQSGLRMNKIINGITEKQGLNKERISNVESQVDVKLLKRRGSDSDNQTHFPSKVSSLSTPIDYKMLQHSQHNHFSPFINNIWLFFSNNKTSISITFMFFITSILGSFFGFNILFPFIIVQIYKKLVIVNPFKFKNFSNDLIITIFIYVIVQVVIKF